MKKSLCLFSLVIALSVNTFAAISVGTFPLKVNYDLSVESLVVYGKYKWKNDDITTNNFPTIRKGETDIILELVYFNEVLTSDEALKELDKLGYRPAEIQEILTFGEKYPDIQRYLPVIALGSVWRDLSGNRFIPYLHRDDDNERFLDLYHFNNDRWHELQPFAAVRK